MTRQTNKLRTWIEVDRKALKSNFQVFRSLIPKSTKLAAVAKSNAYGHDLFQFSKEMEKLGADWIIVDSIVEAIALREHAIDKPILVLGFTREAMIPHSKDGDFSLTVTSFEGLKAAVNAPGKTKIHLKVDTGMSRQGFLLPDLPKVIKILKNNTTKLVVEGLYTHFAAAKNPSFPQSVNEQLTVFDKWVKVFKKNGFKPMIHAAATSATLLFPKTHFDMVRIGIGLYGLWPSKETRAYFENNIDLKPALSWKTIISEIKILSKGAKVGYDFTETLTRKTKLAICPIGYWHGLGRRLSNIGHVLVRGRRARVLGRVSMDIIAIDVTNCPEVKPRDEVVLLGKQGKEEITAYEMADLDETSWYETVTRLNPLIKRIYK